VNVQSPRTAQHLRAFPTPLPELRNREAFVDRQIVRGLVVSTIALFRPWSDLPLALTEAGPFAEGCGASPHTIRAFGHRHGRAADYALGRRITWRKRIPSQCSYRDSTALDLVANAGREA